MKKKVSIVILSAFILCFSLYSVFAEERIDTDGDGISDYHEIHKYYTNSNNIDTDGDGYTDLEEVLSGYSPREKGKHLRQVDTDNDGLSDYLEHQFLTDIQNPDTDGDGFKDGLEVENEYNPKNASPEKMEKSLYVSTERQMLEYRLNNVAVRQFIVSTGKNDSTPKGTFYIGNKIERAWSRSAKLWMPYWMPFDRHLYGFHELPEWPNGVKEGEDHLGIAVSGGCVRLGVGDAQELYEMVPSGTKVVIE